MIHFTCYKKIQVACPSVHVLLYIDKTFIIVTGDAEQTSLMMCAIYALYENLEFSGLQVNPMKSAILVKGYFSPYRSSSFWAKDDHFKDMYILPSIPALPISVGSPYIGGVLALYFLYSFCTMCTPANSI